MKKSLVLVLTLLLITIIALSGCSGQKSASSDQGGTGKTVTLKFNGLVPKSHYLYQYGDKVFLDKVKELSNGNIKIEYYPDGQLGKAEDMISLLNSGVIDIGAACPPYISDQMPLGNALDLPQVFPNAKVGTKIAWDLISNKDSLIYQNDFEKNKMVPLYAATLPLYQVVTVGKKPIKSISDLKGLKLRSAGGVQDLIIKAVGAVPVQMARSEDYQSLQRGTIDGGLFNLPSVIPNKVNEVTKNYTKNANLSSFVSAVEISDQAWNKLSSKQQDILKKAGEAAVESLSNAMGNLVDQTEQQLDKQGFSSYTFTPDEQTQLKNMVSPVWNSWEKDMKSKGLDGQKVIDQVKAAVKKYQ